MIFFLENYLVTTLAIMAPSKKSAKSATSTGNKRKAATEAPLDRDDGHEDVCTFCELAGSLVCCEGCPRAFHAQCIGIEEADVASLGDWFCP